MSIYRGLTDYLQSPSPLLGFGIDAKVVLGGTNVSATNSSPIWLLDSVIGYEGQARLVATHRLTFCSSHTVLLLRLIAESLSNL